MTRQHNVQSHRSGKAQAGTLRTSRRNILRAGALGAVAASGVGRSLWAQAQPAALEASDPKDRKLLFVFCAYGGASIIDSFLPIAESEVGDAALASTLNVYPEALIEQIPGRNLRHVGLLPAYSFYQPPINMGELLRRHGEDVAVVAHEVSSVNHAVGQQRSLNGSGHNDGRTIMESMAMRYGGEMYLPNSNMATGGYIQHGTDATLSLRARHELISSPLVFATGTHGYRGLAGVPQASVVERARQVREQLDRESVFARTFARSPRLQAYLRQRTDAQMGIEKADMIDKLLLLEPGSVDPKLGLASNELATVLRERLLLIDDDDIQAQVGLAFLLAYHGASVSMTMGLKPDAAIVPQGVIGTPIAFDNSHTAHRLTQSIMWGRTVGAVDQLITLLKEYDYMGDPALGKMWDRSLIYIATEFGRSKTRPESSENWGTGHDLNNGSVIISPLIKGDRVYGGVDPKTGITFGFDRETGEAKPDVQLNERDVYSLIAHALDIPFAGRYDFPAVVRKA